VLVGVSFSLTNLQPGISLAPPGQPLGTDGGGALLRGMLVPWGVGKVASEPWLHRASSQAVLASQVHPVKEMRLRKIFPDPAH